MRVMAINSSPRVGTQSKTELMLNHLVEGMREAGAEVEIFNLKDKKIHPCSGCFTCWTKTPGVCIHQDDMSRELYPRWLEADLVVYASPLYHYTVNSTMKAFIERTLPHLEPFMVESETGEMAHPLRHPHPAVVVLSVAGFPEMWVFEQLSSWSRFIWGKKLSKLLRAEIYRPGAETIANPVFKEKADLVFEATRQAGREIIENGSVSEATLAEITRTIAPVKSVATLANIFWKECIREEITPRDFMKQGRPPRPDDLESFLTLMEVAFDAKAARDTSAVMRFDFSGQVEGSCHLKIENGQIETCAGGCDAVDLKINTPFENWMDVITGLIPGQKLFMDQTATAEGDMALLMRLGELFGRGK